MTVVMDMIRCMEAAVNDRPSGRVFRPGFGEVDG
jgi:hypothetical protein